jgi:hypothetical protein
MRQALSLGDPFNETKLSEGGQGGVEEMEPLLSLKMDDDELLALAKQWQEDYQRYYNEDVKTRQEDNKKYYLGDQYGSGTGEYSNTDNIIFESSETLLPIICRENPEALVKSFGGADQQRFADLTAKVIEEVVDRQALKLKIKQGTRQWMIYLLGALKLAWNLVEDEMEITTVKPKNIILDPHGTFDGGRFLGKYIGEEKVETAEKLIVRFPSKKAEIKEAVDGKMGTSCTYLEWWTDEYVFWTFKKLVLDKRDNPHWDYGSEKEGMDEFGQPRMTQIEPKNHFKSPRMPFSFIYVYNLGEKPHDDTSLIEQSKSLQDNVNKRIRQIDKNADEANNSWVFNNQFSQEEAARALRAMRKGGGIIAPTANIHEAIQRMTAPQLPGFVFDDMIDKREEIRNIFGVRGSSASGLMKEKTVQGKIEIRDTDFDRSAVIVEQLEQTIDYLFNYMVQMVYIYYSQEELTNVLGSEQAIEYTQLKPSSGRLLVSVKEGSMIPQSPLIKANQAVDLATAGLLDPETLFERLDYPNPAESAQKLMAYKNPQPPPGMGLPPLEAPAPAMEVQPPAPSPMNLIP